MLLPPKSYAFRHQKHSSWKTNRKPLILNRLKNILMKQYQKLPQLTFGVALKQACNKIFSFKGRARRSEFWWFILAFCLFSMVISLVLEPFVSPLVLTVVSFCIAFLTVPITARRLHDRGQCALLAFADWILCSADDCYLIFTDKMDVFTSVNASPKAMTDTLSDPVLIGLMAVEMIVSITLFVFCVLDSKKEANRYGESPKYIPLGSATDEQVTEVLS